MAYGFSGLRGLRLLLLRHYLNPEMELWFGGVKCGRLMMMLDCN